MAKSSLFDKRATVDIDGKLFQGSPFSLAVEVSQGLGSATKTVVTLYNPNDDTIGKCDPKKDSNGKTVFPVVKVSAGYVGNFQVTAEGSCKKYDVSRSGQNRILEMEIYDNEKWRDSRINKTYRQTKISVIMAELAEGRDSTIQVKDDKIIDYTTKTRYESIEELCKMSNSRFALLNGTMVIKPKGFQESRATILSYNSGLIETPEKILRPKTDDEPEFNGYKIKTLFIYGLQIWSAVGVRTSDTFFNGVKKTGLTFGGQVVACEKKFSTFENSVSEYTIRTQI